MLPIILLAIFAGSTFCQTPVIGGTCKLGTADVQIGGKQTQFFLKCETTADSADGEGVWVVKSRAAAGSPSPAAPAAAAIPVENTQPQQHPKARKPASPNICEQDNGARETEVCAVSATCLQAHNEFPSSYLQCDQTTLRWVRKSCQDGFLFNFEQQTCIVPKRMSSLSPSNKKDPCSLCQLGTACRNGICVPLTTSSLCSDGSPPNGTCIGIGSGSISKCMDGYFCTAQKVCCPKSALHSSIGCQLVCTISESCPRGMSCQNNCCEVRKILRHPKMASSLSSGFDTDTEMPGDIFDSAALELLMASSTLQDGGAGPPSASPPPPSIQASSTPPIPSVVTSAPPTIRCLSNELRSGQQASGLVCTFSSCSNSNPCSVGTCNNGYCCSSSSNSAPAIIDKSAPPEKRTSTNTNTNYTITTTSSTTTTTNQTNSLTPTLSPKSHDRKKAKTKKHRKDISSDNDNDKAFERLMNDFPVGPPGYGFPEHLAKLDEVLVKASGDGMSCAGGFTSSLICSIGSSDCPAGLHCDTSINLCCPLILPLTDSKNPKRKTKRRKQKNYSSGQDRQQQQQHQGSVEPSGAGVGGIVGGEQKSQFSSYACGCMSGGSNNCVGCQSAPQVITIPQNSCPGGGYSVGGCSSGYCATGYTCVQNQCCPSYNSAPRISVYTCPSGGNAVGACISGRCASGYQCYNNGCCPQTTTTNPFVCPDGTQAAGGCVNGQCGTGYTCSNGLCCAGTSTTVKCLDGSDAVGACIPSCTGDGCGGVQVSYYCGSGYTCTTGNICCAINSCPNGGEVLGPTINGLCPTGYTVQGNLCCSATCTDGSAGITAVNGVCPTGYTLTNGVCCASTSTVTCDSEISIGPCTGTGFNNGCPAGYSCDSAGVNCCPVVDYTSESCQVGPAIDGLCPPGYTVVYIPNSPLITNGVNPGTCIDLQCTTGLCAAADQIGECDTTTDAGTCPTGYTCFTTAQICCSSTVFSRLRITNKNRPMATKPVYGRPLHSYMPPRFGSIPNTCSDGSISSGPCMNGLCGIGLECQNGQCCSPSASKPGNQLQSKCPSGETAVSGCFPNGSCGTGFECVSSMNLCCPPGQPQIPSFPNNNMNNNNNNRFGNGNGNMNGGMSISPRPIGARCQFDGECVGQNEGLSMCHAGVCQCSPIAYSQGIACVRRKSFQMNDEPVLDAIDDKSSSSSSHNNELNV